jgi:protein SCO1/2
MKPFIFAIAALLITACSSNEPTILPIMGEREAIEKVIDGKTVIDTLYLTIPSFSFINQDSIVVTDKDFDGKIYVADFFFTSCPSICPVMHRNMLKVYEKFKGNPDVKIISHTIDYKYDTPSVLKRYATKLGIEGTQWEFLRGTKDSVYTIAEQNYLVAVQEDNSADDHAGLVHQGWFVLIDKEKRLRGTGYDGTDEKQVDKLISDMQILLNEYKTK